MSEIGLIHGRRYFCLFFLVGMLLHFTTYYPSFSSKLNSTTTMCNENDRKFLLDILPACTRLDNDSFLDCCNRPGISCSDLTGRIIGLDPSLLLESCVCCKEFPLFVLKPSQLSLEELSSLHLDLYIVSLSKGFRSFIRSFPNLQHLHLDAYYVEGMGIPRDIGNLTRLETLEVYSDHSIYAKTLGVFSRLTSLKRLVLNGVALDEATDWLHVVSNLPHLVHLNMSQCDLPDAIGHSRQSVNSSKSLAYLALSGNYPASPSIASWSWVFNHSSLISLFLSNNMFSGSIPNKFRGMSSLSHLDLSDNGLEGQLPSSLGYCCGLRSLDVSQNYRLQGDLVSIFRSLSCANKSLTTLSLHSNLFTGSLPDFTMFSGLRSLRLHSNKLNGSLPSYFRRPSSLVVFDVNNNQLTGSIPNLSDFRSLKVLKLRNNRLNGSLHPILGQLSVLRHLDISSNSFKDELVGSHLANLTSLRFLDMSFNFLTLKVDANWVPPFRLDTIGLASCGLGSQFPEWLRTQTNYSSLDLSNSGISGTIPFWFRNISLEASYIDLSENRFHGKLPTDLFSDNEVPVPDYNTPSDFRGIMHLDLSRNSFSGPISFLCSGYDKFSDQSHIVLSHNKFSGDLPDCWSEFLGGLVLDLSNNNFSGQLPSSLGSLYTVECLHLGNNNFSGKLPLSLCNLFELTYLDLGDNLFSGEIPACLGNISLNTLNALRLRNNSFSGSIPPQLCNTSIQILDLSMNNISGIIPHCLCKLQAMTQNDNTPFTFHSISGRSSTTIVVQEDYISLLLKGQLYNYANRLDLVKILDLSSNSLTGGIPAEISCLTGLISLNFSGNNLSGSITSKIGALKSLESLDLSNNHLSGEIPSTISNLNFLGTLSLANNNLSGRIPSGTQIQGFNASTFAGNPGLCGEPLPDKCPGDGDGKGSTVEDAQNLKENDDDRAFYLGLCISVVLGFITGFWAFCGALVLKRSWRVAYFRAWIHAYDTLYVMVMVRIRRRYLA